MANIGIGGKFRYEIRDKKSGIILKESDWENNLILDNWFNYPYRTPFRNYTQNQGRPYLCLGEGAVTNPSYTDTDLTNQTVSASIELISGRMYVPITFDAVNKESMQAALGEFRFTSFSKNHTFTEGGLRVGSPTGVLVTRFLFSSPVSVTTDQQLYIWYRIYFKASWEPLAETTYNFNGNEYKLFIGVPPNGGEAAGPSTQETFRARFVTGEDFFSAESSNNSIPCVMADISGSSTSIIYAHIANREYTSQNKTYNYTLEIAAAAGDRRLGSVGSLTQEGAYVLAPYKAFNRYVPKAPIFPAIYVDPQNPIQVLPANYKAVIQVSLTVGRM